MTFKWQSSRNYEVGSIIERDSVTGKTKMKVLSKVELNERDAFPAGKWLYEMDFIVPEDFE